VIVNAADKAKGVTRRFEIDRRCPGLNQRAVVVRFVVVAIEEHQIAARQQRIGHHFIGRGGAVQHKVGFVSVKHFGGKLLRVLGGAFVDEQITELDVGVAHVGAKDILTEKVVELAACRVFFEERAVLVAGTGEGAVLHLNILAQRIEERRQQRRFIITGSGFQLQPLLIATANHRRHAFGRSHRFAREEKDRQVKTSAFEQCENAAAALRYRHDDCRHIRKIGTLKGDHLTVS